jgi:hypothetical protein
MKNMKWHHSKFRHRSTLRVRLLFLATMGVAGLHAQTSAPVVPDGPLLRPAPGYSAWTITYSYAEDRAPKSPGQQGAIAPGSPDFVLARPRTILTTKTKSIIHEVITDIEGRSRENWYTGSTQYRKEGNSPLWFENERDLHPDIHYSPLPANGFRDLDWIAGANFTGKQKQDDQECLVFKSTQKVTSLDSALPLGKELAVVAYINAETRLPVEVDIDTEIRTYQFGDAPTEMQALPPDLAKQIKAGAAGRAVMGQAAARPY